MSASGLDVFDKTLQTTNIWLDELTGVLGPDRRLAWKVLSVVLRTLRDRVPVEVAAHLGAELPLLIRGTYYDQFAPAKQPAKYDLGQFVERVAVQLAEVRPVNPREAVRAVFLLLSRRIPHGQIAKLQDVLPRDLRDFWQGAEAPIETLPA
jgi:uncharacterized protein (DUF2267 family)